MACSGSGRCSYVKNCTMWSGGIGPGKGLGSSMDGKCIDIGDVAAVTDRMSVGFFCPGCINWEEKNCLLSDEEFVDYVEKKLSVSEVERTIRDINEKMAAALHVPAKYLFGDKR